MRKIAVVVALSLSVVGGLFALDPNEVLAKVDERRAVGPCFSFRIKIDDYSKGTLAQSALMSGKAKGANKTMVQYDEPTNMRGKKLLLVDDDMFVFIPKTQRPVRLTPSQRLMGQASNGDVMNVRFQTDYAPSLAGDEIVTTESGDKRCIVLNLSAKRQGSTYSKIVLWVDQEEYYPVKADCYALSGKLIKTVEYSAIKDFGGKQIVSKATLYDKVSKDNYTVIEFLDMAEATVSDNFFSKEYLLRM
jgi:outer membrane lipoprotein-sorting protein